MDNETLKARFGINGVRLAKLTGQDPGTVSRKMRRNQGLAPGPREAGVLACFEVMTGEQRMQVDAAFDAIMDQFSDDD